ncbi:esterase/lipase family protein [Rosenbergiella nectarea]|uniref:esterase/lipase family protein n=2 Tax=Rosenbergiella nectarea TaxID=988801 RepID=UPI001F4F15D6|nr:hypothetical protein [Rosenbergiella nectarea]
MSDGSKSVATEKIDSNGSRYYEILMDKKSTDQKTIIYKIPDRVIPVVFLPGVMGSNLKNRDGESIWMVNGKMSMIVWTGRGAAKRKKLLDPTQTVVDPRGKIEAKGSEEELALFASRRARGWGEVGAISYGTFLPWLQEALNDHRTMFKNKSTPNGKKTLREQLMLMSLHAELGESQLSHAEVALSYKYLFPVHAIGYNWLQSNADSADAVRIRIDKIIAGYKASGRKCEKVILVTHSMGGLVARHYSEILDGNNGDKKILGIVHGVMPNLGSPMAYKRMKTGESGITGAVIGANGAEMTAVMAQSPGPLQLLPGTAYGKGWLSIEGVEKPLPNSEPYTEIYTRRSAWWAMCEDRFINPDNKILDKPKLEKDWLNYDLLITNKVRPFIDSLHGHFHKNTYAFYGNDGKKYPSYGSLRWLDISSKNISDAYKEKISGKGAIFSPTYLHNKTTRLVGMTTGDKGKLYRKFKLSSPEDAGDGTVPVSAAVIESPNLMSQLGVSVDHEGAYGTENTQDARWFTLRSILKIAQAVNDTGLAYDK